MLLPLDQTFFQEHVFKVNAVVRLIASTVRSIVRNLFFLQIKATHIETKITTGNEINSDRTKIRMNLFFVVFRVSVFCRNKRVNWFTIYVQVIKPMIKTVRLHMCMQTNKIAALFLCFSPLFSVFQL